MKNQVRSRHDPERDGVRIARFSAQALRDGGVKRRVKSRPAMAPPKLGVRFNGIHVARALTIEPTIRFWSAISPLNWEKVMAGFSSTSPLRFKLSRIVTSKLCASLGGVQQAKRAGPT